MEYIILIAVGILLLYLIIRYVVPVVLAAGAIIAVIIAAVSAAIATYFAIDSYSSAVKENINFREWKWKKDEEPARRSYFFGPGYSQLWNTVKAAFDNIRDAGSIIRKYGRMIEGSSYYTGIEYLRKAAAFVFVVFGYISVYGVGFVLCAVFGLVLGTVTTACMIVFYLVFSLVWLVDRIYLVAKKIRSDCPECHTRVLIPAFRCPECGRLHKKLVPNAYGIFRHRCECSKKLSATFFNGRSKLEAVCPICGTTMVSSDTRPIVFQLVGGSGAGKTVYLSSFFHQYLEKLRNYDELEISFAPSYESNFLELEDWYNGADCRATARFNSQMYPILIKSPAGVRRQFSVYDIAGEMFNVGTADSEVEQEQFHYCDGILFIVDPFCEGKLKENRLSRGESLSGFSSMSLSTVVENFINYLIRTGHKKPQTRCTVPLSVLIAKSDVKEINDRVNPKVIEKRQYEFASYDEARDAVCREFLFDIGMENAICNLETQFVYVHYFPVSSMGHSVNRERFSPWGVIEPVEWMLSLADRDLFNIMESTTAEIAAD